MATIRDALDLRAGACIAFVGAGGKTTLGYRLLRDVADADGRAVFSTTTNVWQPQPGTVDLSIDLDGVENDDIARRMQRAAWRSAALLGPIVGAPSDAAVPGAYWPTIQTKRRGPTPEQICALRAADPAVTWIVEADGARGLRLKAPAPTEPVIPACADVVAVVACLDALGRPLDDRIAHRADRIAALTGCMPGAVITPPTLVALLTHPQGGRKSIPPHAIAVAVLTQHADAALHPDALSIAHELRAGGFARAIVVAPRAASPVLAVV